MVGRTVAEVSSEANREVLLDIYRRGLEGENAHVELELAGRFYDLSVVPIFDGLTASHVMVLLQDVTTRKQELAEVERARELLETQSITDELTGLLNRRGFMVLATQQMKVATRKREKLVLLFVDLNGMKAINDTFGHEMGDRALYDTGELLRTVFRASEVLARLGGDEFVVLATDRAGHQRPSFPRASRRCRRAFQRQDGVPLSPGLQRGNLRLRPGDPQGSGDASLGVRRQHVRGEEEEPGRSSGRTKLRT